MIPQTVLDPKPSRSNWLSHLFPVLVALVALVMLVMTPVWAVRYYQQPFLGVLLEPNDIVSKINGKGWPVYQAGVVWPEQLTSVNGTAVENTGQVNALVAANGSAPLSLAFTGPGGQSRQMTGGPIHFPLGDFASLFLIPYLVGAVFLTIGLWAYSLRGEQRASRALLVFASAVSLTATTFFDMNTTHHVVLLWALSLPVAASAAIHLAFVFPQQMRLINRWPVTRFAAWVIGIAVAIPVIRQIVAPSSPRAYIATWQASYAYMALAMVLFLGFLTWRILHGDSPIVRQQSRVIIFGATLAFAPMLVFYLLPTVLSSSAQEFRASIYFPLLIILPLSITYAILRYRLLDVDRLLANVLTYATTTGLVLVVFYGLIMLLSMVIRQVVEPNNPILIAMYLLALVLGLSPLRRFVQRIIDRLFYRSPADYRRVLNSLSGNLVITPDLGRTLDLLSEELQHALAPEEFIIYLYEDEGARYLPHSRSEKNYPTLLVDDPLVKAIRGASSALWLPPGLQDTRSYQALGCTTFVPLNYEGSLIGFLALGARRSGVPYNRDDLDFLSTVSGQSALALENARLFTNQRQTLDQTLEMKNLMDDIFASIATGIITTDIKHKVTLFNRAAENILGIPGGEVLGRSLSSALPLIPDLEAAAAAVLENGFSTSGREVTPTLPELGALYLRLSCSPLYDAYLGTKGATLVFEDLTERHRLEAEQEHIRQTFGRVVAPRVRDRLLSDPSHLRLDGLRQQVTILFADLSSFTSFSESTQPEVLFKVLNYYLSLGADAILEEEGTLDKFMGDAVLAVWNAPDPQPDHTLRAVRAALAIQQRSLETAGQLPESHHHLRFRIGITTGDAMVGNVGTSELFNYTAIGDTVNLAQRLETTATPGQILIDQATYDSVANRVNVQALEPVQVKGKALPVAIYELKSLK